MSEKKKEPWLKKTLNKAKNLISSPKTLIPALLMAGSSFTASAENTPDNALPPQTEIKNTPKSKTETKAYQGAYYNEKCNGSPCWLSSTFETRGAGIGKNVSSIATVSPNGKYRGINQMDINHSARFVKWMAGKKQFEPIYKMLSQGGINKSNWQNTAKKYEHLMTLANEQYMVQEYNPDNFKAIQQIFNNHKLPISVKKFHPAILSCIHKMTVQSPASRKRIALNTVQFLNANGNNPDAINSEKYIRRISSSEALSNATIKLMNDDTVQWNEGQFNDLLAKVSPEYTDNKSWFDNKIKTENKIEREQQNDINQIFTRTAEKLNALAPNIPNLQGIQNVPWQSFTPKQESADSKKRAPKNTKQVMIKSKERI